MHRIPPGILGGVLAKLNSWRPGGAICRPKSRLMVDLFYAIFAPSEQDAEMDRNMKFLAAIGDDQGAAGGALGPSRIFGASWGNRGGGFDGRTAQVLGPNRG